MAVHIENQIGLYFHCKDCMLNIPEDVSPKDWARVQMGWTTKGVQVWCNRCDKNVVHLDFKGQKVEYAD